MKRSKLPKIARWMTTGLCSVLSAPMYFRSKRCRHLVVELDRRALPFPPDRVGDVEVDLRAVERPVAFVQRVRLARSLERGLELRLGVVPRLHRAQKFGRTRGELASGVRAEVGIHPLHQPEQPLDFFADLRLHRRNNAHRPGETDAPA